NWHRAAECDRCRPPRSKRSPESARTPWSTCRPRRTTGLRRRHLKESRGGSGDVVEADQVDVVTGTVLRHFHQVLAAPETGFYRQIRRDLIQIDLLDGIDMDFTFVHRIASAYLDARVLPDANAAGDESAPHSFAKAFCEDHYGTI